MLGDPFVGALSVALAKARAVEPSPEDVVIGADTLVLADGELLGKPADRDAAWGMLRRLRGRAHAVLTGVVLRTAREQQQWGGVVSTTVTLRDYSDDEIDDYVRRGEPFDKAGGYAIQDAVFRPVEDTTGCYLNVVGLPLCAVKAGLSALGINVDGPVEMLPPCGYCRLGAELVAVRSVS